MRLTTLILTAILVLVTGCTPDAFVTDQVSEERTTIRDLKRITPVEYLQLVNMSYEGFDELVQNEFSKSNELIANKSASVFLNYGIIGIVGEIESGTTEARFWFSVRKNGDQIMFGLFSIITDANRQSRLIFQTGFEPMTYQDPFTRLIEAVEGTTTHVRLTFFVVGFDGGADSFTYYVEPGMQFYFLAIEAMVAIEYAAITRYTDIGAFDQAINISVPLPAGDNRSAWFGVNRANFDSFCKIDATCEIERGTLYDFDGKEVGSLHPLLLTAANFFYPATGAPTFAYITLKETVGGLSESRGWYMGIVPSMLENNQQEQNGYIPVYRIQNETISVPSVPNG